MNQDVAYGFRMLVDIAVRALSDAFDPTTVVQAIDRLHDALRQLAPRPFPSGEYRDAAGRLRLRVPTSVGTGTSTLRSTRSGTSAPARSRCPGA